MHLCLCIHPPNPLSMNKSNKANQRELMHVWMDEWMHQRMSIGSESIYISRGCGSCVGVFVRDALPSGSSLLFRKEPGTLLSSKIKDGLHGPQVCNNPKYSCTNSKHCERLEWRLYKDCHTMWYLAIPRHIVCMDMHGYDWNWLDVEVASPSPCPLHRSMTMRSMKPEQCLSAFFRAASWHATS